MKFPDVNSQKQIEQVLASVLTYYDFLPIEFENHCLMAIDDIMFSTVYPDLFALFRKMVCLPLLVS